MNNKVVLFRVINLSSWHILIKILHRKSFYVFFHLYRKTLKNKNAWDENDTKINFDHMWKRFTQRYFIFIVRKIINLMISISFNSTFQNILFKV